MTLEPGAALPYRSGVSDFHGGFFVRSLDAVVAEPIRRVLADALRTRGHDLERNALTFAALRSCPVMHVAVRGAVADGKDYAFFHSRHAALGGELARAIGCEVWAYHYENQSGSESVHAFAADGSPAGATSCSWDELADELRGGSADADDANDDDDADADDVHDRMLAAAPLGVLARSLGIPRSWLDMELGYDTPTVRVSLTAASCTEQVRAYLDAPLRAGALAPIRETPTATLDALQSLYVSTWIAEELAVIARALGVTVGTVVWAAWEAGKPELYRTTPIAGALGIDVPTTGIPRFLVAPPSVPPPGVVVPRLVPVFAKPLAPAPPSSARLMLTLALPTRLAEELQTLATAADRSLSWCVQQTIVLVRSRLHAATAT